MRQQPSTPLEASPAYNSGYSPPTPPDTSANRSSPTNHDRRGLVSALTSGVAGAALAGAVAHASKPSSGPGPEVVPDQSYMHPQELSCFRDPSSNGGYQDPSQQNYLLQAPVTAAPIYGDVQPTSVYPHGDVSGTISDTRGHHGLVAGVAAGMAGVAIAGAVAHSSRPSAESGPSVVPNLSYVQHQAPVVPNPSYMQPQYQHQAPSAHSGAVSGGSCSFMELEISAEGLKGKDLLSKSDPKCILEVHDNGKWKPVGETEQIKNDHAPRWSTRIKVTYVFEQHQELRFSVCDVDRGSANDKLGIVLTPLGYLVGAGTVSFKLINDPKSVASKLASKKLGTLTVKAHEINGGAAGGSTRVKLRLSAAGLDKADGPFQKSDPYFQIEHSGDATGSKSIIFKSEVVKKNLNPSWRPATFTVDTRGLPPPEVRITIKIYDHDDRSSPDFLGCVECSLDALSQMDQVDIINPKKKAKKGSKYKNNGVLSIKQASVIMVPSFVSFLQGGCRLRFMCAVDFTASNGNPQTPGTLHYSDSVSPSQYEQALRAVGQVIQPYLPHDQLIEGYGFGAVLPATGQPSFDFPLNLSQPEGGDARIGGVDALFESYKNCVANVKLHGPTNVSPILARAMAYSARPMMPEQAVQHFTVLLILTDGAISDMTATTNKIVEASRAHPLAIVIVGVGNADFSAMERLDGDRKTLVGSDGSASRDIVQFVHWKPTMSPAQLASEVLAEVPKTTVEYLIDQGIQPNSALPIYSPPAPGNY